MSKPVNKLKPLEDETTWSLEQLWDVTINLLKALKPIRLIGYGLLISGVLNLVGIIIPPNFMNPVWELQTIGTVIEQIPMPLIGVALVFLGGRYGRSKWEPPILKSLSWLSLVSGIILLLLIPLGLINTVRVNQQNSLQLMLRFEQSGATIRQVKEELTKTDTPAETELLLKRLSNAGFSPEIKNAQQVAEVKDQLTKFIRQSEGKLEAELQATRLNQRFALLKSSVRWNLGALIFSCLMIKIWQDTRWARQNLNK